MTVIHRNRFVPYKPLLNKSLSSSQSSDLLAVAHERVVVDIFSMALNCAHLKRIVVLPEGLEVESMCFVSVGLTMDEQALPENMDRNYDPRKERVLGTVPEQYELLAIASADGVIRIFSPRTGRLMCSADSHGGGPIWSLVAIGNRQLMAGCEDGIVRLYEMEPDGRTLKFLSVVDRAPSGGKIQRIAYNKAANCLAVALDDGSVRIVDIENPVKTKSSIFKAGSIPTAMSWAPNGNILFVGMSDGAIMIVDPKICQVKSEFSHLAAPVNSIISCGLLDVFAAGVDHRTMHISRLNEESKEWLKADQRRVCNNDVIGMEFMVVNGKPLLIQGCIEGSLRIVNPFRFNVSDNDRIVSGLPQRPIIRSTETMLAANLHDSISIWAHGVYNSVAEIITSEPRLVIDMKFNDIVIDFDLSDSLLAVQLPTRCKVFKIAQGSVEKISSFKSHADMIQIVDDKVLSIEQAAEGILVYENGSLVHSVPTRAFALRMHAIQNKVAVSLSDSTVVVIDTVEGKHDQISFPTMPTCLAFKTDNLLAVYTIDHQCIMHNLTRQTGAPILVPDHWRSQHDTVQGIVNAQSVASTVYAWSEFGVCRLGAEGGEKRRKRVEGEEVNGIRLHDPWRSVIHFGLLNQREAVVVERPWRDVMPLLPPAFEPPKYGQQ